MRLDSVLAGLKDQPSTKAKSTSAEKETPKDVFVCSQVFATIKSKLDNSNQSEKDSLKSKIKSIFQFDVKVLFHNFRIQMVLSKHGFWILKIKFRLLNQFLKPI
jgi:hypothetical protein